MGKMTYEELMMQYIIFKRLMDPGNTINMVYFPYSGGGRDG